MSRELWEKMEFWEKQRTERKWDYEKAGKIVGEAGN